MQGATEMDVHAVGATEMDNGVAGVRETEIVAGAGAELGETEPIRAGRSCHRNRLRATGVCAGVPVPMDVDDDVLAAAVMAA